MQRTILSLALAALLASPGMARAGGTTNLLAGLNSLITFPADFVMPVIQPPENLEDMPGYPVTGRMLGFVGGLFQGTYRAFAGVTDLVTFPFWVVKSYSPEPRFQVIPGFEYESE